MPFSCIFRLVKQNHKLIFVLLFTWRKINSHCGKISEGAGITEAHTLRDGDMEIVCSTCRPAPSSISPWSSPASTEEVFSLHIIPFDRFFTLLFLEIKYSRLGRHFALAREQLRHQYPLYRNKKKRLSYVVCTWSCLARLKFAVFKSRESFAE